MKGESFYELVFPEVAFKLTEDTMVNCPFPHHNADGTAYYETNPSMGINLEKGIFNCFSCHSSGNEYQFIAKYLGVTIQQASLLKNILDTVTETDREWKRAVDTLWMNPNELNFLRNKLHLSDATIKELHMGLEGPNRGVAFPVFYLNQLVDVVTYDPTKVPKYRKRPNSLNGFIMPYDTWIQNDKSTVIVAGQKDLAIALEYGINAITITGGEGQVPELFLKDFTNRRVYIIYDNDETGRFGAEEVATAIKPYASLVKVLDISPVCVEKGEDLFDYFIKYGKTKKDLVDLINSTEEFTEQDMDRHKEKEYPTVTLQEAVQEKYLNKILRSSIQIVASDESKFLMPTTVNAVKYAVREDDSNPTMQLNETRFWDFNKTNLKTLFYLIDNNLKETQVKSNILNILRIPLKEKSIRLNYLSQEPVYKYTVTDYMEATNLDNQPEEYIAYSIKHKLENGKKYKITYKLIPHPFQGNVLTMVIFDVQENQDHITQFQINDAVVQNLNLFKQQPDTTLSDTIHKQIQKLKGIVNADFEDALLFLIDLWYNTPLRFNLGNTENLRANLDTLIIAESRVGKTTTALALQELYQLGTRVPLNGHSATIAGIVGGSQKTKNGYQTRAGVIPRNHRGAIIFEELAKASAGILGEISEIRSSGWASISRVSGTIHMPAQVRMLTLTNTAIQGDIPKPISSYPNGIEIIVDLVGKPEDIARYDIIAILPSRGAEEIDPFFTPETPYPVEAYRNRIYWIWSRTQEQIVITKDVYTHTIYKANQLSKTYDSYLKLFGTETYLKLLRIAIAIAGYTVSTDETYEKIIVNKEHIDYAAEFLKNLYDNETFRFKQYVDSERTYRETDDKAVEKLQLLWQQNPEILIHLENHSSVTSNTLRGISGLDPKEFNIIMSNLAAGLFVRFTNTEILPTERFRKTMKLIDRNIRTRVIIL